MVKHFEKVAAAPIGKVMKHLKKHKDAYKAGAGMAGVSLGLIGLHKVMGSKRK